MKSFSTWLESTVNGLERQIKAHPVFDSREPASQEEIEHLRTLAVLHRFLSQELERRTGARSGDLGSQHRSVHAA